MNLGQILAEVEARGFDDSVFGLRITQWINDAQFLIARRVNYYVDESAYVFSTVAGTSTYPWPADFGRMRNLFDTTRNIELEYCSIRDIDRSVVRNGAPTYYADSGQNVVLYPVPDGVYPLEMRYWKLPTTLVSVGDTPNLPADWHWLLRDYALQQAFLADDDPQMSQTYQQSFATGLSMFSADVKFPDMDGPTQARSMWDHGQGLNQRGWSLWTGA